MYDIYTYDCARWGTYGTVTVNYYLHLCVCYVICQSGSLVYTYVIFRAIVVFNLILRLILRQTHHLHHSLSNTRGEQVHNTKIHIANSLTSLTSFKKLSHLVWVVTFPLTFVPLSFASFFLINNKWVKVKHWFHMMKASCCSSCLTTIWES